MKEVFDAILVKEVVSPICIIIGAFLFYLLLSKIIKKVFRIRTARINSKKQETLCSFFLNIARYFIIIIATLMILEVYGVNTRAIVASLGVVGVVLGLALQDMIKDFIGGVAIVLDNTYNVGDLVTINEFKGEVISLGMRTTRIKAYNGDMKIINNGSIKEVTNHSVCNAMAIISVGVSYDTDLDKCEKVLTKFCEKMQKEIETIQGEVTLLGVDSLADSAVIFKIAAEVEAGTQYTVERKIRKLVKQELDKNNITIPYPQVVIHHE